MVSALAPMAVDVNGIIVNCEVKLNAVTPEFLLQLQNEVSVSAGAKLVEKNLAKWDVTDEKDKPLPPTYENIVRLPQAFINAYLEGVKDLKKQK